MKDFQNYHYVFNEKIDTTTAENNFEDLLQENKTLFLNGTWGSGKTEFITKVQKRAITREGKKKKKLILLDLWRSNNTSIFTTALRVLSPKCFALTRFFIIFIICCFIWLTGIVKVPSSISSFIKSFFNSNPIMSFIGGVVLCTMLVASVSVVISKYLGLKLDLMDHFFLERLSLKNKVLVVDDFDRLTTEQQKNAYKLFTLLKIKNKMPIVFVGDYQKLACRLEENYLIKVIDQRVELPFVLHPVNIWNTYFSFLENDLNVSLSDEIKELFISENRNLRDRSQFHTYVCQEFYTNGKKGSVQVEEQLLVIYTYLFNNETYQKLVTGSRIDYPKDDSGKSIKSGLLTSLKAMQAEKKMEFPLHFSANAESYFIFESVKNASFGQMKSFLVDKKRLHQEFSESYRVGITEFTLFVRACLSQFNSEENEILTEYSVKYFKIYGSVSSLTQFVIEQNSVRLANLKSLGHNTALLYYDLSRRGKNVEVTDFYFYEWSKFLDREKFEFSEKINFFTSNYLISYPDLANKYDQMNHILADFTTFKYPAEMLLIYLSSKNKWYAFDTWDDSIWGAINKLSENQFKFFCKRQNISAEKSYSQFTLARVTTASSGASSISDGEYFQDNTVFLKKMNKKIEELSIEVETN